jgi:hypothetical protein
MSDPSEMQVPMAALAYQPPPRYDRPGVMTAVGVISIVVASLSILSSLSGALSGVGMLIMAKLKPPTGGYAVPQIVAAPINPAPIVTVDGVSVDPTGSPDGLEPAQRQIVVDGLSAAISISSGRRKHLDVLLENSGKKMLPFVGDATTADDVRQKIIAAHSASPALDVIDIATGSIRLTDLNASFYPNGKGEVVQAIDPTSFAPSAPTSAPMPPPITFPFRVSPVVSIVSICENLVSLLVAGLLLAGGIALSRNSPKFWKPHWWFVWLKMPLVVVAVVAQYLTYTSMMSIMAATPGGGAMASGAFSGVMLVTSVFWGFIGLAYPVALIIALSSRTAKDYYNRVRGIAI